MTLYIMLSKGVLDHIGKKKQPHDITTEISSTYLDWGEDWRNVISRTPAILQNIETYASICVNWNIISRAWFASFRKTCVFSLYNQTQFVLGALPSNNRQQICCKNRLKYLNKTSGTLPLGWNILEVNRTVGGLLGYSSVNSTVNLNVPIKKKMT